jgi:hypothetical protein
MERESIIKKAIKALNNKECPTVASAARKYGIPSTTLQNRYTRVTTTRQEAHEAQMVLNLKQEEAIVQWIGALTSQGFPPTYALLRARIDDVKQAENLNAPPVGINYITKLLTRHPRLGAAFADRRDKKRAIVGSKAIYEDFF